MGVALSGAYVLVVLAAAWLLSRAGASAETARKVVHIGLGGWWVIASLLVGSALWAAALPAAFVVVNGIAYRTRRLSFMAREEGEDTPGTVYYAASLAVLAFCAFGVGEPYVGALGVFCMSFGDGLAAVAGRRFGRRRIAIAGGGKTVAGSAAMFVASFLSCAFVLVAAPPVGAGAAGGGGGALAAPEVVAALGVAANLDQVIIGGIIPLVPGMVLTTSFRDFANGDYLSGTIRIMDALLVAGSIAVGVGAVFAVRAALTGGVL